LEASQGRIWRIGSNPGTTSYEEGGAGWECRAARDERLPPVFVGDDVLFAELVDQRRLVVGDRVIDRGAIEDRGGHFLHQGGDALVARIGVAAGGVGGHGGGLGEVGVSRVLGRFGDIGADGHALVLDGPVAEVALVEDGGQQLLRGGLILGLGVDADGPAT
jgi:hypothetical protein